MAATGAEWTVIKTDDLSEWSDPGRWWRVENGVFIADSEGGNSLPKIHYLEWKGSAGHDLELSLEYRILAKSPQDAGVNFRVERPHGGNLNNLPSYQAELDTCNLHGTKQSIRDGKLFGHIHDGKRTHMFKRNLVSTGHPGGRISTRPLPQKFVPARVFRKPPGWNVCRVVAAGGHVQLFLNGALANEIHDRDPKNRPAGDGIALQYRPNDGYRFEIRNLKFRPVSPTAAMKTPPPASVKAASALAQAGKLAEAADMLEQLFAGNPKSMDTMGGLGLATLYAALGDEEKHRRICETFFRAYAKSGKPADRERPAKAYLLFPKAGDSALLAKAMAGARHAVKVGKGSMPVWFELTLGMTQYRTGDHAAALKSFTRPLRGKHAAQRIPAKAFSAMANFKRGNTARARQLLAQAESDFRAFRGTDPVWADLHAIQLAIDEAKELIR